jgi:hypothetical protein
MGNENEHQQQKSGGTEQGRKNPLNEGGQNSTQQDPSKKNPSHGQDPRQHEEEGSEMEKRRAS